MVVVVMLYAMSASFVVPKKRRNEYFFVQPSVRELGVRGQTLKNRHTKNPCHGIFWSIPHEIFAGSFFASFLFPVTKINCFENARLWGSALRIKQIELRIKFLFASPRGSFLSLGRYSVDNGSSYK